MPASTAAASSWRAHLERFRVRLLAQRAGAAAPASDDAWGHETTLLGGLGVGLHETVSFVLERAPSADDLERWIADRRGGALDDDRRARLDAALAGAREPVAPGNDVLTEADLAFFDEHGYVVVRGAVDRASCAAAERAVWAFLGMDPDDPGTWYGNPHGHSIWVPLLHDPALSATRSAPRVRRAYQQLWNRGDVWPIVDQAGFNPPERPGWNFPGPFLHWDTSLTLPIPLGLQGLLYLADASAGQGAFTCVPGFHRGIDAWLAALPAGADPRERIRDEPGAVPISGRAGDLVVWHHALPHGSSPNRAARPRVVQYVTYLPSLWARDVAWR